MTHDSLINRLTEELKPVRRRRLSVDILAVAAICALELILFLSMGMARPDMPGMMMHEPSVWWRLASLGLIGVISCALAVLSFNPVYSPKRAIRWLMLIVAICLAFGVFINAGPDAGGGIIRRLYWPGGLQCTYKMVLLSIPPVIGLAVLMRRGAPTDMKRTALLAGLAAASWGAFVFVFACPSNDPLYIAVWYSVGCGIVTALSRIILPSVSHW
jgi:hypothetical protein